jgi:hypothetical protein
LETLIAMVGTSTDWPDIGGVQTSAVAHARSLQADLDALDEFGRSNGHIPATLFEKFTQSARILLEKVQLQGDLTDAIGAISRIDRATQAIQKSVSLLSGEAAREEPANQPGNVVTEELAPPRAAVSIPPKGTEECDSLKLVLSTPLIPVGTHQCPNISHRLARKADRSAA